jgi:hypothetical protein
VNILTAPMCLILLALAACTPQPDFPPVDVPVPGHVQTDAPAAAPAVAPAAAASIATCAGTDILNLIGQNVSKLPTSGPWSTVRILKPDSGATMDYSPTRLNVHIDKSGKILDLACG